MQGYETVYFVPLLGTSFLLILLLGMMVLIDLTMKLLSHKVPSIDKVRRKWTSKWLYWNGIIRLFLEIYMNVTLFSLVNLANLEWDTFLSGVNFTNTMSILAIIVAFTAPVVLIVHAFLNLQKL